MWDRYCLVTIIVHPLQQRLALCRRN